MLLVATYLSSSPIDRTGVMAKRAIGAGETVWRFTHGFDVEIFREALSGLPQSIQQWVRQYGSPVDPTNERHVYRTEEGIIRVPSELWLVCGDNARFLNHSEDPNTSSAGDDNHALRDILTGEELTCNYAEFDVEFREGRGYHYEGIHRNRPRG